MKYIMLSINPPYAEMIINEKKPVEFRNKVVNAIKNFYKDPDDIHFYIYETKRKGGRGKVIGEADMAWMHKLSYNISPGPEHFTHQLAKERNNFIQWLYYFWCAQTGKKPNPKEGWFRSSRFSKYMEEIGFQTNCDYAVWLCKPKAFEIPVDISEFSYGNGTSMSRPPQGMCYCLQKQTNTLKN